MLKREKKEQRPKEKSNLAIPARAKTLPSALATVADASL